MTSLSDACPWPANIDDCDNVSSLYSRWRMVEVCCINDLDQCVTSWSCSMTLTLTSTTMIMSFKNQWVWPHSVTLTLQYDCHFHCDCDLIKWPWLGNMATSNSLVPSTDPALWSPVWLVLTWRKAGSRQSHWSYPGTRLVWNVSVNGLSMIISTFFQMAISRK